MVRHITVLNMEEAEAKAEFLRHTAQVKDEVPADKVRGCLFTVRFVPSFPTWQNHKASPIRRSSIVMNYLVL